MSKIGNKKNMRIASSIKKGKMFSLESKGETFGFGFRVLDDAFEEKSVNFLKKY